MTLHPGTRINGERRGGARSGMVAALALALALLGVGAMGWLRGEGRSGVGAHYLEVLNTELNQANVLLEAAADSAHERVRAADLIHKWTELDGEAGSGGLMVAIQTLRAPMSLSVPRSGYDDLLGTGRLSAIEDPMLRRELAGYYADLSALQARRFPAYEAFRLGLDEHLPVASWRFLEGLEVEGMPLDYKKTVAVLHEQGFKTEVRGVLREFATYEKELRLMHERTIELWAAVRARRAGRAGP